MIIAPFFIECFFILQILYIYFFYFLRVRKYNIYMRKILFVISCLIFLSAPSFADYMPAYTNSLYHFGSGLMSAKGSINVYPSDDDKTPPVAIFNIDKNYFSCKKQGIKKCSAEDSFVAFVPENDIALFSVEGDYDNWFYICYDQSKKLFGWVKKSEFTDFISWENLLDIYGRKYGVYLFRNTPDKYKKLYSGPDENNTMVDDFYYPKHIALWLLSDDWMLVKVTTYDGITKTGWMRWRLDDDSIIAFPAFK